MKIKKITKKTIIGVSLPIMLLGLTSCDNKEKKALDSAIQSRELSQMRQFINQYSDANKELVDSAMVILAEWEQDSADYTNLINMDDIVERAEAESLYLNNHPDGLYKDLVTNMYATDEPEANVIIERRNAIRECLDEYSKNFTNYVFYNSDDNSPICLTSPDENGNGIGFLYTPFGYVCFYYSINLDDLDDDTIQCVYYLKNNKETHFTISLSSIDHCFYYKIKGKTSRWYGQLEKDFYASFLKRAEEIRRKGTIIRHDFSWL